MNIPSSTYRIQFRNGMTFDRAAALVPYLKRLGISHLYASPVFTATSGSTHGYDVTNANEIEPSIGGRKGFDRMVRALRAEGLGLILDIVPNHMAASLENPWWRDVVEHGEDSRYAHHFDIDWSRRLTLPFLGNTFEKVLEAGELSIKTDPTTDKSALAYYETFYPLKPGTYTEGETDLAALHARQPYRLMSWRDAPRDLSYRRFFEITGLAGLRVEDDAVFDDAHRLILDLVHSGAVDGLRVDHVDGLANPKAYLERLRQKAGPDCYITVEKILGEGEHIPSDWPISGTTGYEFIAALSDVFVDGEKLDELRGAYEKLTGKPVDMEAELRDAKLLMATKNFEGEATRLRKLAMKLDRANTISEEALGDALREMLIAFPVYRTYGEHAGMPPAGVEMLSSVLEKVRRSQNATNPASLQLIEHILLGNVDASDAETAAEFRTRFQQLTGPLMAKSVEDTLFFRQHMLLALNEVGAEPLNRTFSVERFHDEMKTRLQRQPDALSGTSTHDTKRGEDARARLYTLSEAPQLWAAAVERWRDMNKQFVTILDDGPAPEPAVEWMLYQALAGVWPNEPFELDELRERFLAYTEKAIREAKLRTNWGDGNEAYETAVLGYVARILTHDNFDFLADFETTITPFIEGGLTNGIAQTIIKLTAPGVPDIYQGSEGLDLSLVDPDNRREPDFSHLEAQLSETGTVSKQQIIRKLLHLRLEAPSLFRRGDYIPLHANGEHSAHIVAFARVETDDAMIVLVPRLTLGHDRSWDDTHIALPAELANRDYRNVLTGKPLELAENITISQVFADHPFAVLVAE